MWISKSSNQNYPTQQFPKQINTEPEKSKEIQKKKMRRKEFQTMKSVKNDELKQIERQNYVIRRKMEN